MAELVHALESMRDDLLRLSLLLGDHLEATDAAGRDRAGQLAQTLLLQLGRGPRP